MLNYIEIPFFEPNIVLAPLGKASASGVSIIPIVASAILLVGITFIIGFLAYEPAVKIK